MQSSDDESYAQSGSDDEGPIRREGRRGAARGAAAAARGGAAASGGQSERPVTLSKGGQGFEVARTWENIDEAADGTIRGAIEELLDAGKRRRILKDTTPIQRGIIRHLVLILDLSASMMEKDLRPTRYLLTIRYATEFVTEYFEQNPISQLCIIGMREGLAVPVTDMGGNPSEHIKALNALRRQEGKGDPSLQNAFNMARGALYHTPSHGTREILLIFGSLLSSDPGDIHKTITELVQSRIMATVVGLSAEVAVCRTLVTRTNPTVPLAEAYGVALNEQHYRELFMRATTPPATGALTGGLANASAEDDPNAASLLMMGFPSRSVEMTSSLCACHSKPTRAGYTCSRCASKVCALPSTCPVCSLTLILSTHLARSYHHLFPLRNWAEVSWARARSKAEQGSCFSCLAEFPSIPDNESKNGDAVDGSGTNGHNPATKNAAGKKNAASAAAASKEKGHNSAAAAALAARRERDRGVSESGRYECETCGNLFCIDCDVFAHEVVHNCPGCQSSAGVGGGGGGDGAAAAADDEVVDGDVRMGGMGGAAGGVASAATAGAANGTAATVNGRGV